MGYLPVRSNFYRRSEFHHENFRNSPNRPEQGTAVWIVDSYGLFSNFGARGLTRELSDRRDGDEHARTPMFTSTPGPTPPVKSTAERSRRRETTTAQHSAAAARYLLSRRHHKNRIQYLNGHLIHTVALHSAGGAKGMESLSDIDSHEGKQGYTAFTRGSPSWSMWCRTRFSSLLPRIFLYLVMSRIITSCNQQQQHPAKLSFRLQRDRSDVEGPVKCEFQICMACILQHACCRCRLSTVLCNSSVISVVAEWCFPVGE